MGHATAWKRKQTQTFAVLSYGYGESRNVKDTNKFFSHFRHAHELPSSSTQLELFSQWQYNEFQRLNSRFLLGTGLRRSFLQTEATVLYGGAGGFWYREDISNKNQLESEKEEGGRWNTYLALQWKAEKSVDVFNTIYFQPHMERLRDHHLLWDFQLKFLLSPWLSLTLNMKVSHDNEPPEGIKTTDSSFLLGLSLSY